MRLNSDQWGSLGFSKVSKLLSDPLRLCFFNICNQVVPVLALDAGCIRAAAEIDTDVRTHIPHTSMLILLALRFLFLIAWRLQALFHVNLLRFVLLNGESTSYVIFMYCL